MTKHFRTRKPGILLALLFSFACMAAPLPGAGPNLPQAPRQDPAEGKIHRVEWSDDGRHLLFTRKGERLELDLVDKKLKSLGKDKTATPEATRRRARDRRRPEPPTGSRRIPRPGRGHQYMTERSPDGAWYAVCRDWNVLLENDDSGESIAVTEGGNRKFRYGTANWVYGEELRVRHGMWWSKDAKKLVFYKFDEGPVKDFHLATAITEYNTTLHTEGYMKAGAANPVVSLLMYDLESGETTPVETGSGKEYLFDMRLTPDGSELLFNRTDRRQKRLDVMALDFETGKTRIVVTETQETWQENHPLMLFLADGKRFIWETEKTGWQQYELRHLDGSLINTLTRGEYPANRIVLVDEKNSLLFYEASSDDHPLCPQLHSVHLDGRKQKRLTTLPRTHSRYAISPDRKWFTAQFENVETPPSTALYSMSGELVRILAEGPKAKNGLSELFTFKAGDGKTDLFGILHKPADFDPALKYTLIVPVYGGPGSRAVRNTYQSGTRDTRHGVLIARIDNRGTSGRGKAFMGAVYGRLGDVDIGDQAAGVRFLRQRPYVDGARVGIYGHSYGGYMAAIGALKHSDVFRAGVARSAVTDWRQYDSIYTERYMNLPQDNADGYRNGTCANFVEKFDGHLLIMHGMLDDNVHANNAWQLIDALDKARKKYESRFFPKSGHGGGGTDTQWGFFRRYLIDAEL
jgi:dipeptidyl-peptidase 4